MPAAFPRDLEFHKLLARRHGIDLARLMLEFAADAYPQLDEVGCLAEIERLGARAATRMAHVPEARQPLRAHLQAISELLYFDEGFHGNRDTYYDPRNSYLNDILERRCGIPISLGIVYLSVAAHAGLTMRGVCTPGHFVLACDEGDETWYVDPFNAGTVLDRAGCTDLVEGVLGQRGVLRDEHFRTASPREIAVRVLRNLKAAHAMENNWEMALPVQQRLAMLLPQKADERRDLGLIYLRTGQAQPALELLESYLETCRADEAESLAPYLDSARRMVADL